MAEHENNLNPLEGSQDSTIRFTVNPSQPEAAQPADKLDDTFVGTDFSPPKKPKRPAVPMGVRVAVVCAMAALALSLLVSFLPRPWVGSTAQEVVADFLSALDNKDVALLQRVAIGDEVELTQQSLAPLFAAYAQDPAFGAAVVDQLSTPTRQSPQTLFWLEDCSTALRGRFVVHVGAGTARVRSNLPEASITVGEAVAVWNADAGVSVARGLLPGIYTVSGIYEAPHGAFEAEGVLLVTQKESQHTLQFDFTTLSVYNSATQAVRVQINGSDYATLEPQKELVISPVLPDAQVTVVGPKDQALSTTPQDGYFYVSFALCQVEVYNDYTVPMEIILEGQHWGEIPPGEKVAIADVPAGQTLIAQLNEVYGLEPFSYQAAYDYDYLYPTFQLKKETFENLRLAAETYALVAYTAYGQDLAAMEQLPVTALTRELTALWQGDPRPELTAEQIILSQYGDMDFLEDGSLNLTATISILERREGLAYEPSSQELNWTLTMQRQDGLWRVLPEEIIAPEPPPESTPAA